MARLPFDSDQIARAAAKARTTAIATYRRLRLHEVDWSKLRWERIGFYSLATVASVLLLVIALGLGLNTGPGKNWLLGFVRGYVMDNGLRVRIGGIDGSLYGDMTLRDIQVLDDKGVFATSPKIHLDWRPLAYLEKHVDVRDLSSPRIDILRQPVLRPTTQPQQNGSTLPDLDIDLNRLQVDAIALHPGVAGMEARTVTVSGAAHMLKKRVQATLNALSDGGDEASVRLDAQPEADKLNVDAHLSAPDGGVIVSLLHLDRQLRATLAGNGSWKNWNGTLNAQLGDDSLTDLKLGEQDGRFTVKGVTRPDLILGGESAAILQPHVAVDLDATLRKRSLDMAVALDSDAATVRAKGLLDLAYNRFGHVEVHAKLLHPERLDKDFTGQDLHADLRFDGAFVTPRIEYDIEATRFGLGSIKLAGLHAEGKSHVDNDGRVLVPVNAEVDSFTGINEKVDPLLQHLKLTGDVELLRDKLTSDNLHAHSDKADARATLLADLGKGMFESDIKAGLKAYRLEGVGTADLETAVKVARTNKGQLTVAGTFTARSTQLENASIEKTLGGNLRLTGGYGLAPGGRVFVQKLSGDAPEFKLTSGDAAYGPKDAIIANLKAESKQYGPLELAVTGTINAPVAVLKAAHPGLGMQIADVVATLTTTPEGYAVKANGGSSYGPFDADTVIIMKDGPLAIDVKNGHFAGVGMAGRIQQTKEGPFAGTLALNGSGLSGTATLTNVNGDQGAAINAVGNDVAVPGQTGLKVGRTIISANAVLRKQIEVDGDVQFAAVTQGDFTVDTGRAKLSLRGDNGTVQAVAHGQKGVPFDLAVNAKIAPDLYTVALKGKAQGGEFHLKSPARIHHNGTQYVLDPVTLVAETGTLDIAGSYGDGYKVQARLNNFDLAGVDVFVPSAGVSGKADGAVEFAQSGGGFPTAHANLKISNFTRASAAVVSTPVDMVLDAALDPSRSPQANYVRAIFRDGSAVIGRLQLNLTPDGGDWLKSVQTAGVTGGIRYNGPAGVLFSLAGQGDQQLDGPLAVAADITGNLDAPHLNGVLKARSLIYDNDSLGTRVTNLALDGRFTNDRLELTSLTGTAGNGTVKGNGWVSLASSDKFPLQVHVDLANAHLAKSESIDSTVSGTLDLSNDAQNGAMIKGDLRLPELRYAVIRQGGAEVNELEGVHHKGYQLVQATQTAGAEPLKVWKLDVKVRADNQIFISGMGLDSEWRMNLHVGGTTASPRVDGQMETVKGYYEFAGRDFNIDRGTIRFNGGPLTNPEVDLSASGTVNDVTGIIAVTGSAEHPDIAFSSTPSLPQDEVLSRMLFGEGVSSLSATEALQLASAVNGLRGGKDYLNPLGALRQATGIDRLRVVGADATTGRGTSLAAGKYLTNNVYVEIVTDTKGFAATQIEVALSRALSVLSQASNTGTAVSVKYSRDY